MIKEAAEEYVDFINFYLGKKIKWMIQIQKFL